MTIDIQILTTTAAILDADGRAGVGTIRIRPNQPFQYNDGVTDIQVTDAVTEIAVSGGQLQSALTLAPNTGASNVPTTTYYIVEVDVNTITYTEYWRLANTPTSLEWGEVTRISGPDDAGGDALTNHIQSSNPHRGLVLRSDTVDAAATGTVSDGRGAILRLDPATGKFPANAVGTVSITDLAVTTAKIEALAVTAAKLAANAVETAKILDAAVTLAKMADLAADRIIGRANGAGTGVPTALTAAQVATIIRSQLLSDAIANGETSLAPTQNAVYDALLLKMGAFSYYDQALIHAGTDWQDTGLDSSASRFYVMAIMRTVSAGDLSDYTACRLLGSAGAGGGPSTIQTYKSNAGASTVTVRCWYTTVY